MKRCQLINFLGNVRSLCFAILLMLPGCGYSLLSAASDGDTPRVLSLLDNGMDVNASSSIIRIHPLTLAAAGGHLETVCTLLDRGAQVAISDLTGWTALHAAAYKGHREIVQLLVERGAPVHPRNWMLPEPQVWAEKAGHTEVVTALNDAEANVSPPTLLRDVGREATASDHRPPPCPPPQ